jgi:hypothetical protein
LAAILHLVFLVQIVVYPVVELSEAMHLRVVELVVVRLSLVLVVIHQWEVGSALELQTSQMLALYQ